MNQKYCSIDLEFTGFDPEKEQILEIGFAFFEVGEDGLKVTETWSQVFQPTVEVHPKILGLTGISQEEIDSAPQIADFRDFLSEKLSDCILVAHNPTLDVKFLEMAGVKLSGQVIDTLELVQFLLPTHHSYNLENLMHYFGIDHKDSHRALGDSISTIKLLEQMIRIFCSLPQQAQTELRQLFDRGEFVWEPLLDVQLEAIDIQSNDSLKQQSGISDHELDVQNNFVLDTEVIDHSARVAKSFAKQDQKVLIVTQSKQEVLTLWQRGLAKGLFDKLDLFSKTNLDQFMVQAQTNEELRFCMKIIVWLHTNWQTATVLDLNLSFFGGQFKSFIVGGDNTASQENIVACDYHTLQNLAQEEVETDRQLVICDVQRFEKFLTSDSKDKLSWSTFNFITKSVYNPETGIGQEQYADQVVDLLSSIDLFFGLVQIVLRKHSKNEEYIELDKLQNLQDVFFGRLTQAAHNLSNKLHKLGITLEHPGLLRLADELTEFFVVQDGWIKWIELTEENVYLHSQPIEISQTAQEIFSKFAVVKLTDTVSHPGLLFYLVERLGLNTEMLNTAQKFEFPVFEVLNQDLKIQEYLLDTIQNLNPPAVVIMPTSGSIKSLYKDKFDALKEKFHLFAQEYSGSGNKIFRNFRIFANSLLLATSYYINKQKYSLAAQTILFVDWPAIDTEHPYYNAILNNYQNKHPNIKELLALSQVIMNLKQFNGFRDKHILVSREFFDHWQNLSSDSTPKNI